MPPLPQTQTTLYILYNANASIIGKLNYGFRKLTAGKDAPPACAACDITHGGLHLDETDDWQRAKEELLRQKGGTEGRVELKQLHRDEVSGDMKQFMETRKLRYPIVLSKQGEGELGVVVDHEELAACKGNAQTFVTKLVEKGAFRSNL